MKIALTLLAGLALCVLAACGEASVTGADGPTPANRSDAGYLGSGG